MRKCFQHQNKTREAQSVTPWKAQKNGSCQAMLRVARSKHVLTGVPLWKPAKRGNVQHERRKQHGGTLKTNWKKFAETFLPATLTEQNARDVGASPCWSEIAGFHVDSISRFLHHGSASDRRRELARQLLIPHHLRQPRAAGEHRDLAWLDVAHLDLKNKCNVCDLHTKKRWTCHSFQFAFIHVRFLCSFRECHEWPAAPICACFRRGPCGCSCSECCTAVESMATPRVNRFLTPAH